MFFGICQGRGRSPKVVYFKNLLTDFAGLDFRTCLVADFASFVASCLSFCFLVEYNHGNPQKQPQEFYVRLPGILRSFLLLGSLLGSLF
jgi:SNF family Na+-dependent transporter